MSTTFHITNFKNVTINMLTGVTATPTPIVYVNPYNGTQTADPSVAPTGVFEFATLANAPNVSGRMTAAGGGISQLSVATQPSTPSGAASLSSITTARLYTSTLPLIDVVASTSGGGGGVILDSLTSTAAVGNVVQALSLKLPFNNGGTLLLSTSLVDRLVDLWGGGASVVPQFGVNTGGTCFFNIYAGTAPGTADTPLGSGNTLLAQLTVGSSQIWNTATGGSASLASQPSATASASGTATFFRMVKTYGSAVYTIQGAVGTSGTDATLNTTALTGGVTTVQLVEMTISI